MARVNIFANRGEDDFGGQGKYEWKCLLIDWRCPMESHGTSCNMENMIVDQKIDPKIGKKCVTLVGRLEVVLAALRICLHSLLA